MNAPRKMDADRTGYSIRAVGWCCLTDVGYECSGENGCRLEFEKVWEVKKAGKARQTLEVKRLGKPGMLGKLG